MFICLLTYTALKVLNYSPSLFIVDALQLDQSSQFIGADNDDDVELETDEDRTVNLTGGNSEEHETSNLDIDAAIGSEEFANDQEEQEEENAGGEIEEEKEDEQEEDEEAEEDVEAKEEDEEAVDTDVQDEDDDIDVGNEFAEGGQTREALEHERMLSGEMGSVNPEEFQKTKSDLMNLLRRIFLEKTERDLLPVSDSQEVKSNITEYGNDLNLRPDEIEVLQRNAAEKISRQAQLLTKALLKKQNAQDSIYEEEKAEE